MIRSADVIEKLKADVSSDDFIARDFSADGATGALLYVDGMSDKLLLEQSVVKPLLSMKWTGVSIADVKKLPYGEEIKEIEETAAGQTVANGDLVLALDGAEKLYEISLRNYPHRAVAEPPTETVIKGPREGFTEEVKTNVSLVRRRIKSPRLKVKKFTVGKYGNTTVMMVYIDDIVDKDVVLRISEKIKSINIDGIIGAEYVSRFVSEHAGSIFNQSGMTEKPDIVSAKILEGRVALFIDGTPVVITYPYVLLESFQDGYDYYVQNKRATMLRIIRIIGAFMAVLLPGLYVAFQEYHYQLMPLKFLISLLNSVSGIPFTPPMEMLFVLALFEVLNQASVRMPRYVGTALSIVGAIVLGETAVNAGLLSSPTVLVIAISAIGINCVPDLVDTFSILRLAVLITGSILGLFGIVVFSMGLIAYLCGLDSFGSPYLAPFAPMITADFKDAVAKENLLSFEKRPYSVPTKNRRRMRRDR